MTARLILIRHGDPAGVDGHCVGHYDPDLAPRGADAVRRLAATASDVPKLVLASDLRRCAESAAILARAWQTELRFDPRVRELSFGDWEGRHWDEIGANDRQALDAWGTDWTRVAPPGGETGAALAERARASLDDARRLAAPSSSPIAIVSHAGWIRVATTLLLGEPLAAAFDRSIACARAAVFTVDGERATLDAWNVARLDGKPISGAGVPRPTQTSAPS